MQIEDAIKLLEENNFKVFDKKHNTLNERNDAFWEAVTENKHKIQECLKAMSVGSESNAKEQARLIKIYADRIMEAFK